MGPAEEEEEEEEDGESPSMYPREVQDPGRPERVAEWGWPRTYEPPAWWRVMHLLFGLAVAAAIAGWLLCALLYPDRLGLAASLSRPVAAALTAALTALAWAVARLASRRWRPRVVLHRDAIEVHGLMLPPRRLALEDIAGFRRRQPLSGMMRFVATRPGAGRHLPIHFPLDTDLAFHDWLAQVSDLDALERDASLATLSGNPALGPTAEARLPRFAQLKQFARLAGLAVAGLLFWAMWSAWSHQAATPVLLAAPWAILALVAASKGLLRLGGSPHDVRPDLAFLLGVSCVAPLPGLLARANLVDGWGGGVTNAALGLGVVLAALAWWVVPRPAHGKKHRHGWAWRCWPLWCVYAGAATVWANAAFDPHPPRQHQTVATYKRVSGGPMRTFSLKLDPWGALAQPRTLKVSQATFNSVSPGEAACVAEHAGRWRWRWTEVLPCPAATPPASAAGLPPALYRALKLRAQPPGERGALAELLRQGRDDELDARLAGLQQRFEQGQAGSDALLVAYRDFYDPDPDLDAAFDRWVARYPRSYPAALARGIHLKFQAEALHAAGFERQVSPDWNAEGHADRQVEALEASTRLTAKPTLSYVHLLDAAMHRRQPKQMRAWMERGLAAEPGSLVLSRKYLVMLRPMYGGSLKAMQAFVDECRGNGTPPPTLKTLEAILLTQRGWASQHDGRDDEALALFRQAAALEPFGEDLNLALRAEAGLLMDRRQQFDAAIALLDRAVQAQPTEPRTHGMRGHTLERLGRKPEAAAAYRQAAELGDTWAQLRLGQLHLLGDGGGVVEHDTAQAARWLEKAAKAGNQDAKRLRREHAAELPPR